MNAAVAPARVGSPYLIAFVCGMAAFMEVLDTSIANVALFHISGSLSVGPDEAAWVLTSYIVANAIIMPMTGWLSNALGRRRYYLLSMLLFTLASILCGLAPTLPLLIVFRVLQGLAGGALQPVSQAIIADAFPPEKRGMAMAVYGIALISGPALGPPLGGLILEHLSWQWLFLAKAPISVLLIVIASRVIYDPPTQVEVQRRRREESFRVDYIGFALIVLSMGALQIMMDKGQQEDWLESNFIASLMTLGLGSLLALIWWELRHPHPVIDLRLLKDRNFAVSCALTFSLSVILFGTTLLLPQIMQGLFGYSALDAGIALSPGVFATMLLLPLIGRLIDRADVRILISIGFLIITTSAMLLSNISLSASNSDFLWMRTLQMVGIAFLMIPINAAAFAGIQPGNTGNASALVAVMRNMGSGVGISIVLTYLARGTQAHQAHLVDKVSVLDPAYQQSLQALSGPLGGDTTALAAMMQMVQQQAALLAYLDDFRLLAFLSICMLPLVWLLRRPKRGGAAPPPAH